MTAYEWSEIAHAAYSNSIACVAIIITVFFAYLVAAYTVGHKLTRSQLILINSLFLLVALWMTFCIAGFITGGVNAPLQARAQNPDLQGIPLTTAIPAGVAVMELLLISGCLKFMWDIRHPG